ncbi:hypothetical protein [Spirillospora sp. NPDC048819]|uniref:hypothetical protein n=1 Tax=Spirillospora sp. NPDC048819 TaxID=3155268 RepID=UPI0033EA1058
MVARTARSHAGASGGSGHGTSGQGMPGQGIDGASTSGSRTCGHGTILMSTFSRAVTPSSGNTTLPAAATTCREAYRTGRVRASSSRLAARVPSAGTNAALSRAHALPPFPPSSPHSPPPPAGAGAASSQRAACPSTRPR